MKRSSFLQKTIGLLSAGFLVSSFTTRKNTPKFSEIQSENSPFTLPALPYAFDALEPSIDKLTMEIHHDRHHKAYVDNLNKAVANTALSTLSLVDILTSISKHPVAIRNNGGGHWNHSFFWQLLSPSKTSPSTELANQIQKDFGSMDNFKAEFAKAATTRFGSGWAWLLVKDGKLVISSTPNQDNPLMDVVEVKGAPIMALDVWEHAYYLKYQNKRADYINSFWNVLNWDFVSTQFANINK
ncbi:superoxide dismutase [Aquirufa sp. ROCK2-A2]